MSERLPFFSDCVGWPRDQLGALTYLVDEGVDITRETFFRHIRRDEIPAEWYPHRRYWGYSFHRLPGHPIYWYVHSLIEFVFATPEAIEALSQEAENERRAA